MATFSPTESAITELVDLGYSEWTRRQFTLPINRYEPRVSLAPNFDSNALGGLI